MNKLFWLDLCKHTSAVCRSAYFESHRVSATTLVCTPVLPWNDYCNSVLAGITLEHMAHLQRVQNNAAQLTFCQKDSKHVTPLLKSIHWLAIKQHIKYKLTTFAFHNFNSTLPFYLSECLSSLQIPSILLWQTTLCPTSKSKRWRC